MPVVIDTRSVPTADTVRYWMESARAAFNPLHMTAGPTRALRAQLRGDMLGPLGVFRIVSSQSTMTRTAADVAAGDPECLQLTVVRAGSLLCTQHDRTAVLGPGDMTTYDTSAPAVVRATGPFEMIAIRVPKQLLGPNPDRIARLTALPVSGGSAWPRLAAGLCSELADGLARGWVRAGDGNVVSLVVDLLHRMYAELEAGVQAQPGSRDQLRARAKAYIEERIDDPQLDPERVALGCYVSLRTLHYAFSETDASVAGWIRQRRLEGARRELADDRLPAAPIASIGARWGFTSASAFSRQFREAYGAAPSQIRRTGLNRSPT